jgi:hypothetical protein
MLSDQWFLKMGSMAQDALEVVARGEVKFIPQHWTATYNHSYIGAAITVFQLTIIVRLRNGNPQLAFGVPGRSR